MDGGKHNDTEGKTLIHSVNAEQRECEPHEEIETIVQETNETLLELKKIVKDPNPPEIRKKKDFEPKALQAKRAEISDLLVKLQTRNQKRNIEDIIAKSAGIFDKLSPQDQRKAIHKVLSYFDKVRDQAKSHQITPTLTTDSSQVYSFVTSRFDAPQKETKRDDNGYYQTKSLDLVGKATDGYWFPDERHFTLNLFDTKPNDNDKVVTIIIEDDPLDTIDDIAAPRSRGEIMKFGTSNTDTVKNLFATTQTDDYDNAPLIADDEHDDVALTANDDFNSSILASDDEYTPENVLK
ncbi:hypothetical protein CEXT_595311 [Caerostris extrusa]|uniref:Uncharacterized protein n=1 Tax=Caerostris extrusa TaxID=172846 RepID=A0AAV4URG3_CAEEX|nr:hypothetical protein CEXT_595311 [Caerostris extrusa]